jgi:hypothetical protein
MRSCGVRPEIIQEIGESSNSNRDNKGKFSLCVIKHHAKNIVGPANQNGCIIFCVANLADENY